MEMLNKFSVSGVDKVKPDTNYSSNNYSIKYFITYYLALDKLDEHLKDLPSQFNWTLAELGNL